jgi:DNA-binding response OmpR family regulator
VDDTPDTLRLLSQVLSDRGIRVQTVTNGRDALAVAPSITPDLILLDIMMPEMNGFEVCRRLKADARSQDIPIIFISAIEATEDKVNAFAAGGVDYVTKPFYFKEVVARVEAHLTLRRLQRQLQQANIALGQRIRELQVRNEELAAYDHTVAHDLKAPLSTIISGAGVLEEVYGTMPAEEYLGYLKIIGRNARKMNNIIDELMLLAGLRQAHEVTIQPLDMSSIVAAAQQRLADMIEDYEASVVLSDRWPVALGYGPWVEEVWVN